MLMYQEMKKNIICWQKKNYLLNMQKFKTEELK